MQTDEDVRYDVVVARSGELLRIVPDCNAVITRSEQRVRKARREGA
jgi:hypothetical protein